MSHVSYARPKLRPVLGLLVIAGVTLLAFLPNTGAIPASSSCTYGSCSSTAPATPTSWFILLGALIIVAAALGVLLFMRRRRPPTASGSVEPWSGPTAGAAAAGPAAGATMPTDGGPSADYIETDSDVAAPHPEVSEPTEGGAEGGGDIDSLMQELDKISGEILQRGKPKTPPANSEGSSEDGGEGQGQ